MTDKKEVEFPALKWAQRKDKVMITIDVPDIKKHDINLTPEGKLTVTAETDNKSYALDLDLNQEIDKEASAWNVKGRNILLNIVKKDAEGEYWPRLTKEKTRNSKIQTDWSKWVDEDEEDEEGQKGMDGYDPSQMQGFGGGGMPGMPGGMGGMGGMPGMGGMGGMGMPGMGGEEGMPPNMNMMNMGGGPGGMDMAQMQEMLKNMGGGAGMGGAGGAQMPDSDDEEEEEEASGAPMQPKSDGLGDLDGEADASVKKDAGPDLD